MSIFGTEYLVDNNTLNQLSKRQVTSTIFQARAHIPSEVLYEARDSPHVADLPGREYSTTPAVLARLVEVMATVRPGDTELVDLYRNQGNADPLIIACALDARDRERQFLDAEDWVIVTEDKAVRRKAEEFGIQVLGNDEFAILIDASGPVKKPE